MELGHLDKHKRAHKNYILNGKFSPRMKSFRAFFSKTRAIFLNFGKGKGRNQKHFGDFRKFPKHQKFAVVRFYRLSLALMYKR